MPSSDVGRFAGALPGLDPPQFVCDDADAAVERAQAPVEHPSRTWWHRTTSNRVESILRWGILPGCWLGHDTCVVFGLDDPHEAGLRAGGADVLIEVVSPVPLGDVKALWVPPQAVLGLQADAGAPARPSHRSRGHAVAPTVDGCVCDMAEFCRFQQRLWRAAAPNLA